jgi:hypothetical protein
MSATNPYTSPTRSPEDGALTLRDHVICAAMALMMWMASAAVLAAFAFGAMVAIGGPYSELGGGASGVSDSMSQLGMMVGGAAIIIVSTGLAFVTFLRVRRGRYKTSILDQRRAEMTRAVETLRNDIRQSKAADSVESFDLE